MPISSSRPCRSGAVSRAAFAAGTLALPALTPAFAHAEEIDPTVVVIGERDPLSLARTSETASRLGLSARDTPASLETLSQADLQERGLRTSREAFNDVVGAIAGNVPGNPAVVTLRGFSGAAVSILQDGVRVSTSTVVIRDSNTWHYDRIEVIKGPASVLYGEGALAGVINRVTRKPDLAGSTMDALIRYGSFDTVEGAAGVNLRLSDAVAVRADASYQRSDSLYDVENNDTRSSGLTGSVLIRPSDGLSLLLAVDHFEDRYSSTYQGVPFIPRDQARDPSDALESANGFVIDRALRRRNYNPFGGYSGANETTMRARLDWRLGGGWSLANDVQRYRAKRDFVLSGDQVFVAPSAAFPNGSFARSVQQIFHDHRFWNERLVLGNDGRIAGLRNRFSLGGEYNETRFGNPRRQSPVGAIPAVDPFDPEVGSFPVGTTPYTTTNVRYDSRLKQLSVFAEDALNLTNRWLLVGGVRYDHIALDRFITDFNKGGALTQAHPIYDPVSWRLGTTYDPAPWLTLYAQHTTAVTPVSSILLQSIANTGYRLTRGRSWEGGFKASAFGGRVSANGAVFHIRQDDILTRDPNDPQQTVQGGTQSSRGVELDIAAQPTASLRLRAGAAYTKARYDELVELVGTTRFDRTGNAPINTPSTTVNASILWAVPGTGLTVGGFLRHASAFYTDTANTYRVRGHTTLDASLSYPLAPGTTLTARGRNLTDAFYGEYSGYPVTNVYIGATRSFEIALATHFGGDRR